MRPVYLCGFMGCGKSHIGRLLSKELTAVFIDLDRYIVTNEKMTIPEIFSQYGEPYFRDVEAKYIKQFKGRTIVATGGGAMLRDETAQFAREQGTVFFLDIGFEKCYERIKDDENRPLVVNNTKEQLREIFEKRYPIYKRNSDYIINADRIDTEIAAEIAAIADKIGNKREKI